MDGAVFDVEEAHVQKFDDSFEHARESGQRMDFEIEKCKELPDLLDLDKRNGGGDMRGGFGGRGGGNFGGRGGGQSYGGRQQGYGGGRGGFGSGPAGGGGSRGGRGNSDASVFVGNLDYNVDQNALSGMFNSVGIRPVACRVLKDDQGRSKGSAFVDFASAADAQQAISYDGR